MTRPRTRDELGALGGVEGLAFSVLVFVVGTIIVANAWGVLDTKMAVSAAAREAARAYVESTDFTVATQKAKEIAMETVKGHRQNANGIDVTITGGEGRCQPVTVAVKAQVPRISLPLIRGVGGVQAVKASHSEIVDPYRSGLPGEAHC